MRVAPVSADLLVKIAMLGIGIGVAVWAVRRVTGAVSDAAASAWGNVVEFGDVAYQTADRAVSTPVYAVGDWVGIPRTNMTECERAKAEGRTWDASFACPAGDFIEYVWAGDTRQFQGSGASGSW